MFEWDDLPDQFSFEDSDRFEEVSEVATNKTSFFSFFS